LKKLPSYASLKSFEPDTFAVIVLLHVMALAAPFTFSWPGLIAFIVLSYVTCGLGITLTYHRLLTHSSYKCSKPVKYLLTLFGVLSLQGGPIYWSATHRLHHRESDKEMDPHTPMVNFMWAHLFWNFFTHPKLEKEEDYRAMVPDLFADAGLRFMEKYFFVIYMLFSVLLYSGGLYFGGPKLAISMFVWGVALRTVYTWHITWLVNSATHTWGYQNYDSKDDSRNTWWVALLTFGEGWHNNHHAHQRSAHFDHRWYEFDLTAWVLRGMEAVGLAHDVIKPTRLKPTIKSLETLSAAD
jgi:fatty-acid desaturase